MSCPTCADSGLICPDAFGHIVSWDCYVSEVAAYSRKHGIPEHVSPLLTPHACPDCSSQSIVAGSSVGVVPPGAGEAQAGPVPGHDEELFTLGMPCR